MYRELFWFTVIFLFFFGGSTAGFVQHLQARRHKFKLDMLREQVKFEQERAKALAEQNRQTELQVRKAELEIERFDRRIPGLPSVPLTDLSPHNDVQ